MPSSHLILCHPLFLLSPIPPSIRVFSNESTLHMRWPKYWSFIFSISPSNEHPGLISLRVDWLYLHESQHIRPPYPSPTPGVHSNSCPLSQRCQPTISSSVVPFSSCPQSLPASESFPTSQLSTLNFSNESTSTFA